MVAVYPFSSLLDESRARTGASLTFPKAWASMGYGAFALGEKHAPQEGVGVC